MSTIAEVSETTGFSREGVEAISRARLETGATRDLLKSFRPQGVERDVDALQSGLG